MHDLEWPRRYSPPLEPVTLVPQVTDSSAIAWTVISPQSCGLWERGVRSPTLRTLFRLAGHLGVKLSDLLRQVESKVAGTGTPATAPPSP